MIAAHEEESRDMPRPEDVEQVKPRRQRIGFNIKGLAQEAGVSRDTLSDLEAGLKKPHPDTVSKVLAALDRLEKDVGLDEGSLPPGAEPFGAPTLGLVEFTVEGNFGVKAVVKGPVSDIEALQKAAAELIASMNRPEGDEDP